MIGSGRRLRIIKDFSVMIPGMAGGAYEKMDFEAGREVLSTSLPLEGCVLPNGNIVPGIQVDGLYKHHPCTIPLDVVQVIL